MSAVLSKVKCSLDVTFLLLQKP